jgi:hypothetical protein
MNLSLFLSTGSTHHLITVSSMPCHTSIIPHYASLLVLSYIPTVVLFRVALINHPMPKYYFKHEFFETIRKPCKITLGFIMGQGNIIQSVRHVYPYFLQWRWLLLSHHPVSTFVRWVSMSNLQHFRMMLQIWLTHIHLHCLHRCFHLPCVILLLIYFLIASYSCNLILNSLVT